jgi:hypothetical protein
MRRGLTVCEVDVCMKILRRMKEQTVFGNDLLRKEWAKESNSGLQAIVGFHHSGNLLFRLTHGIS